MSCPSPNSNVSTSATRSFDKLDLRCFTYICRCVFGAGAHLNIVLVIQVDQHIALVMLGMSVKLFLISIDFLFQVALSETKAVISFAQRVNFGLMTTFNVCLLCDPIFIKSVIDAVTDTGGVYSSGFIHQKGCSNSRGECNANQIVSLKLFFIWNN